MQHQSILLEQSVVIAWDYLKRTGQVEDGQEACRFLTESIEAMMRRGLSSRLLLANKAIAAYQDCQAPEPPRQNDKGPTRIMLV